MTGRWRVAGALACAILPGTDAPAPRLLGIEHVPITVTDLAAAERRWWALGFTLKPGRPHADGIRNAHVKFADGSYIELITAPAARDPLTAGYRLFLSGGDGPAFVSLYVDTMSGLAARLATLGARPADDTVLFPAGPLAPVFFGTRSRSPTDRPEHYVHANGARSLAAVWLAPADPAAVERMAMRLGARFRRERACLVTCGPARVARLRDGAIVLLPASRAPAAGRPLLGLTIAVPSVARTRQILVAAGIPFIDRPPRRLIVPATAANGAILEFSEGLRGDHRNAALLLAGVFRGFSLGGRNARQRLRPRCRSPGTSIPCPCRARRRHGPTGAST